MPDAVATSRLFVYGSLKPARSRWPILSPYVVGAPVQAEIHGRLWDTPHGWPAVTLRAGESVPGVLVGLRPASLQEALARLDEVEGCAAGLFERVEVVTTDGVRCWTYVWPGSTEGFTPRRTAW